MCGTCILSSSKGHGWAQKGSPISWQPIWPHQNILLFVGWWHKEVHLRRLWEMAVSQAYVGNAADDVCALAANMCCERLCTLVLDGGLVRGGDVVRYCGNQHALVVWHRREPIFGVVVVPNAHCMLWHTTTAVFEQH